MTSGSTGPAPASASGLFPGLRRAVRQRGVRNAASYWAITNLPRLWKVLNGPGLTHSVVNENFINQFVMSMEPRPPRLTTMSDYTSWASLTNKTYSARHLPPVPKKREWPEVDKVRDLFERPVNGGRESEKSTLLFPFFAQWFVDGFLRTDPSNGLRNQSTHAIDLCQLYGLTPAATKELRLGIGGKLKYREAKDGGHIPPKYTEKEFPSLRLAAPGEDRKGPVLNSELENDPRLRRDEQKGELFAVPLARGNVHYGMLLMSTIFLREHNRVAGLIAAANTDWKDEELFQTARNVMIVMLHKIVIEEYLNHITPFWFQFSCEPGIGNERVWFRPNWMSIEFDLLYRWHALMPDSIDVAPGETRKLENLGWYTTPLVKYSLEELVNSASRQRCMEIGLFNTPRYLLQAEKDSIELARKARLPSYNDYREACHYPRLRSFADITSDRDVQKRLSELYDENVNNVEFYVGLFAEDIDERAVVPMLMGTMVGVDAFSQALTNPLLDPRIFSADTFSEPGLAEINATRSLYDIVKRVAVGPVDRVTFEATGLPYRLPRRPKP
jgi:prostaglandin-endoperoxide synthase 2